MTSKLKGVVGRVRHVRMLGICMAAMLALAAATAAGASAEKLPAWGTCEAAGGHEGKYADPGCIEPVKKIYGKYTGGYEWHPQERAYDFESGLIGPTTFETTNGKKIACENGALEARQAVAAPNRVREMLVAFYGCESEGRVCSGKFEEAGRISNEIAWFQEQSIEGELVYLSGKDTTSPVVGLTLTTEVAGQPLFTVSCDGELGTVEIGGAGGKGAQKAKGNTAIGVVSPIDEMTTEYTQTFKQTSGAQEPAAAEKGKAKSLQMFLSNENEWVQAGLASTFTYVAEPNAHPYIEIKAVS
jgi:hypothetical protein